jgi:hypothetical protein
VLRLVKGAASAFFPEYPKISRSQKGMLRCFWAVVRWCPFGQLFGDYSTNGKLLEAESAEGTNMRTYQIDSSPVRLGDNTGQGAAAMSFLDI